MRIVPSGDPTRGSLLARIRDASDAPAWNLFVQVYGPFIHGMCRGAGLDEAGAADAVQNVFLRIYRAIHAFEYSPERGRFRGWLCRLTRNEVAAVRSRARRDERLLSAAASRATWAACWEDGSWEESFSAYIERVALERVRGKTSKRAWTLFKLTWLVGCSADRVALRFGIPVARVFEAKCRTLRLLRDEAAMLAEDAAALAPLGRSARSR